MKTVVKDRTEPHITEYAYKGSHGLVVESLDNAPITSLPYCDMYNRLLDAGFIIFRGFDVNVESFSAFVRNGSGRVTIDPMRELFGKTAQKVDAGYAAIGMHVEHGNNPFKSDMCWFYCQTAANRGSQTTVCDGYQVWEKMPETLKQKFTKKKIKYCRYIEAQKWKTMVKTLNPNIRDVADVTLEDLKQLAPSEGVHVELRDNQDIYYEFTTSAVHKEERSGRLAFANSILGPSYNYQAPKIVFEDNEEIMPDVLGELERIFEDSTTEIDWVSGDIAVIDNVHVMHGRRAIEDKNRTLFAALSFRR